MIRQPMRGRCWGTLWPTRLRIHLACWCAAGITTSAAAQEPKPAAADSKSIGTKLEFRTSPAIDLYFHVRTIASSPDRTEADAPYADAIDAGRKLGTELGQSMLGWGIVEGTLYGCESAQDIVSTFGRLPEKYARPNPKAGGGEPPKEAALRAGAVAIAEAIAKTEENFLKSIWPEHERLINEQRRRIIESLGPKEPTCLSYLIEHLGPRDPGITIPVYLVADMPFPGAETDLRPGGKEAVVFIAVRGGDVMQLVETVFHESTHALDVAWPQGVSALDQLRNLLREAGDPIHDHDLRDVPHTLMFVHAGETVRRIMNPRHLHYGDVSGYYQKVPRASEAVRGPWIDYLDGKISRDGALLRMVNTLEAEHEH